MNYSTTPSPPGRANTDTTFRVCTPFPIIRTADEFLVFSADAALHIRSQARISGMLTGTLPQAPQQNLFHGLPLLLANEEVKLLVDVLKCAFIVTDTPLEHAKRIHPTSSFHANYTQLHNTAGILAANQRSAHAASKRAAALGLNSLSCTTSNSTSPPLNPWPVTLTFAGLLFPPPTSRVDHDILLPPTPNFHVYRHLHAQGMYLLPGLRFGCQWLAYPEDPLRYHSHYLVQSFPTCDTPINLRDIVAGGRLGTGVKKAYLIAAPRGLDGEDVDAFCFEWAAM